MIITEQYSDDLLLTYSDMKMKIRQEGTGALYDSAIDPWWMERKYTETDIPIDEPEPEPEGTEE